MKLKRVQDESNPFIIRDRSLRDSVVSMASSGHDVVTGRGVLYWSMLGSGTVGPGTVITCARYSTAQCLSRLSITSNNLFLTLVVFNKTKSIYPFSTVYQLGPLGRVVNRVAMSVCLFVCLLAPSQNTHFRRSWRTLVKDCVPNIGLE